MPEPSSKLPKSSVESEFRIVGDLVVSTVACCLERLKTQFANSRVLAIDLGAATGFDAFGLQLLWSVRRSAEASGRSFSLVNVPEAFTQTCKAAGFAPDAFTPIQPKIT